MVNAPFYPARKRPVFFEAGSGKPEFGEKGRFLAMTPLPSAFNAAILCS